MRDTWYAGLDAHSRISSIVILDEDGQVVYEQDQFRTCQKELIKHVSHSGKDVLVLIEAANVYEFVGDLIEDHVQEVIPSDPRKNDLVSETGGGDWEDAHQLARLLRLGEYSRVHRETNMNKRVYRDAFLEYNRVNKQQSQLKQNTQLLFQKWGLHTSGHTRLKTRQNREEILDRLQQTTRGEILRDRFDELRFLLEKKEEARKRVQALEHHFPIIEEYKKMPGGGFYTANGFVTKVINPFRFKTRKQLHKYSRLAVKQSDSANKKKSGTHINKAGHGMLKDVLYRVYTGALNTKKENGYSRFYKVSLSKSCNGKTEARLNTMRKICDVMWSMWKNNTAYDDDRVKHPDDPLGS